MKRKKAIRTTKDDEENEERKVDAEIDFIEKEVKCAVSETKRKYETLQELKMRK